MEPREKISTNPTFELLARQPAIENCSNAVHGLRGDNTAQVETDQLLCYISEVLSVFLLLFLEFFQPFYREKHHHVINKMKAGFSAF